MLFSAPTFVWSVGSEKRGRRKSSAPFFSVLLKKGEETLKQTQTNLQKQIGESLKRFGIADDTTDVLVARFGPKGGDPDAAVAPAAAPLLAPSGRGDGDGEAAAAAAGVRAPLSELSRLFDAPLAARLYHVVPAELRVGPLDEAIACRVGGMECL
jgi:hypothetical protein